MAKKTIKNIDDELKLWVFVDEDGGIYPPDVCPFFFSRRDAIAEKRAHNVFYSDTKIKRAVVVLI